MSNYGALNTLTPAECAKRLNISKTVLYDYLRDGRLKSANISEGTKSGRYCINEDDFREFQKIYEEHQKTGTRIPIVEKPKAVIIDKIIIHTSEEGDKIMNAVGQNTSIDIESVTKIFQEAIRNNNAAEELRQHKEKLKIASAKAMELAILLEEMSK